MPQDIKSIFVKASTKSAFELLLQSGNIKNTLIAFILDTKEIWTLGVYFPCPYSLEEIDERFKSGLNYKGTLSTSGINTLKASSYKSGWCWKWYGEDGTFAGEPVEKGDLILCIANKNGGYSDSDFMVIQANLDIKTYTNAEIDLLTSDTETRQVELSIIPATGSADAEGYEFYEGAAVWIKITNTGNEPLNGTLECEMTGDEWTITNLKPFESKIFSQPENTYHVTEDDILAGSFYFEATFTGSGTSSGVTATSAKQWMSAAPPNGHLTVTVSDSDSTNPEYALGAEPVLYVNIVNDGNLTISDIEVNCDRTADQFSIQRLAPGDYRDYTLVLDVDDGARINESDILMREALVDVTATGTSPDPDKPDVPVDSGELHLRVEEPHGQLTVHGTCVTEIPEEGFAIGDAVEWQVYVANDGNLTIGEIEIICELTGDKWDIDSLAPGESSEYFTTGTYYVTEDDVLSGRIPILVTAEGVSPDPDEPDVPVEPYENTVPTVEP